MSPIPPRPLALSLERGLAARTPDRAVRALQSRLAGLQEQATTGLRVNRPSDDPTSFERARYFEAQSGRIDGHLRTVGAARLWVDETGAALSDLADYAATAQTLGVQGRNDALGADEREALAKRVESLLAQSVDRLNAEVDGESLFAGNRTDQRPFNADGTPASGALADYGGARVRRVGPTTDLALNVTGERVQTLADGTAPTDALRALADALRANDGAAIETALGGVTEARDHFIELESESGEVSARLSEAEAQLADADVRAQARRSELEDADLFEVASGLQTTQGHLEAALRTVASVRQRSLLDYLR